MYTISAILWILGACLIVLYGFITFSEVTFLRLLITMVPVLVFGFYLSYNIRRMVASVLTSRSEAQLLNPVTKIQ